MKLDELKQGFSSLWESAAEGWQRLRQSAAGALTAFKPGDPTQVPAQSDVDDDFYLPTHGWSMLGGDLFEDGKRVVVRLEVPGMEKENFDIEVLDDVLVVRGQKRFERESSEGRYRLLQCAYGSFRREFRLPAPVLADQAKAGYRNGVLKIELPKAAPSRPKSMAIRVD